MGLECRAPAHTLVPGGSGEPSGAGVPVPAVPPGPGRPAAGPAGAVGRARGPVPGPAGPEPAERRDLRLRSGLPPLRPDGDGVGLVQRLSDAPVHRDLQLGLGPIAGHTYAHL